VARDLGHILGGKAVRRAHVDRQRLVHRRPILGDRAAEAHAVGPPPAGAGGHEQLLKDRQRLWPAHAHDPDPALAGRRRDGGDSVVVQHAGDYSM
jgi:hypothetical protein